MSIHSVNAISSARASIASATLIRILRRSAPGIFDQAGNAALAAATARSMSPASDLATGARTDPSTGLIVSIVSPEIAGTVSPSIWFNTPVSRKAAI